ncbi:hypothetical protein CHS0354_033768 [Potamilus streckersoni]|uniref:BHLH domain-containing protein n=1 Tax=Potamilus streckersoni TaxID=2493646 RepID=A0AAE0S2Q0_9BIVA|nr:hypothetical protein CHS0354_033768 [Potamilus streckersoni]
MTNFSEFSSGKKRRSKRTDKHVPHSEKPLHLVAKRNARERKRVQAVNSAFLRLRRSVPYEPKHKRLSKVKTLKLAIEYIKQMSEMIEDHDRQFGSSAGHRYGNQTILPTEHGRGFCSCNEAVLRRTEEKKW